MSLILVYIAIAFTVVALVLTVLPLVGTRRERVWVEFIEEELRMIEALASKRAVVLQQLRDLEFDSETDKVSDEDYQRFKRRYELHAVAIMRQLDAIRGGQNWDKIVDAEIKAHMEGHAPDLVELSVETDGQDSPVAQAAADSDEHDSADAGEEDEEHRDDETSASEGKDELTVAEHADRNGALICGSCGTELDSEDRFCRECGASTPSSQDAAEASA
jgi:hypothetical protein